jgi:hypothetical protein
MEQELAKILGTETNEQAILARVRELVAADKAVKDDAKFQARVRAMISATHMSYEAAMETINRQDEAKAAQDKAQAEKAARLNPIPIAKPVQSTPEPRPEQPAQVQAQPKILAKQPKQNA